MSGGEEPRSLPPTGEQSNTPEKTVRIGKLLSRLGLCSRRAAADYLNAHRVEIQGTRITDLNAVFSTAELQSLVIEIDGKRIRLESTEDVILLHKPRGVVSSHKRQLIRGKALKTIFDLLPSEYSKWFFAGRLDIESEGLIVLSNDGDHIFELTHPSSRVMKKYFLKTSRPLSKEECERTERGIIDKGEKLRFTKITPHKTPAEFDVWLQEGKNREIRRVLERLGVRVRRLVRLELGPYQLEHIPPGEWRKVGRINPTTKTDSHLTEPRRRRKKT